MNSLKKHLFNPWASGSAFLLLLILIFGVLWILVPPPPKSIEIATGFPTGLYYQFAERLKVELGKEGVKLEVKETGGTIDNLALLKDPKSGVNFAMVQGGVADISQYPNLVSLAGMFYEPIWVWYREAAFKNESGQLKVLNQLKGKRVSIGNEGSGTLALSNALLVASGIELKDLHAEKLKPDEAIEKFNRGELDAVFIVAAAEAPILKKFYTIPGRAPQAWNLPKGCRFQARCAHAVVGVCDEGAPPLESLTAQHAVRCFRQQELNGAASV